MSHVFQPSFDDLSDPLFDVSFCTLDLETTGGSPANCEITEIGAVKHKGGEVTGAFQTLVDPGLPIPPSITVLTGITQAMVIDAPSIDEALPSFLEFIGESVIVGHNVRFDLSFLNSAATRLGYGRLENQHVDTAALARRLVRPEVRNLKLKTLAAHFRSPVTPNHRALEDARATAHVFHSLLERAGSLGVTNLDDLLELPRAKGAAHYSKIHLTETLPRSPGVYMFKDRHGTPIYVGKATNLRGRVRQYFYGDKRRRITDLMRELHTIEHQVCETVLEAGIAELRLIHAHRPRYNRRSRPPKSSHFVKVTAEEFPRLSVVRALRDDGLAYLGPFRSKKTADLVVMALWDAVPIRRCRSRPGSRSGKCAPAQLGMAHCPCDGELSSTEYDNVVRVLLEGIRTDPHLLLKPLAQKMRDLASVERYEEAAWLRDRHDALARSLELRARWTALNEAGMIRLEDARGRLTTIDHGTFVGSTLQKATLVAEGIGGAKRRPPAGHTADSAACRSEQTDSSGDAHTYPLELLATSLLRSDIDHTDNEVPPDVRSAEETSLIWHWMSNEHLRLVDCSGVLSLPIHRIVRLQTLRAA